MLSTNTFSAADKTTTKKSKYSTVTTEYRSHYSEFYKKTTVKYAKNKKRKELEVIIKNKNSKNKVVYKYYYNKVGQLKSNKYGNSYKNTYYYFNNDKVSKKVIQKYNKKGKFIKKKQRIITKPYKKNRPKKYIKKNTKVISHRGVPSETVGHTFHGYDKALKYGSKYIELDLVMTKDNKFVIHHSMNMNETTKHNADIRKTNLRELKKMKYSNGEEIKTLEEVFKKYGKRTNYVIETRHWSSHNRKHDQELINIIKKYKLQDKIILQSFNINSLKWLKTRLPKSETILLASDAFNIQKELKQMKYIDSICYSTKNISNYKILKSRKYDKNVYMYTANNKNHFNYAISRKLDGVFTDYTNQAIKYFKK